MGLFNIAGQGWQGIEPTRTIKAPLQAKHISILTGSMDSGEGLLENRKRSCPYSLHLLPTREKKQWGLLDKAWKQTANKIKPPHGSIVYVTLRAPFPTAPVVFRRQMTICVLYRL